MSTLSVSLHVETLGQSPRAFLWNGQLRKHCDAMQFVATFSHPNIFELLRALTESVDSWSAKHGNFEVVGIDSSAPCWPLDGDRVSDLSIESLNIASDHFSLHCGGYKGLLCSVVQAEVETKRRPQYRAIVHDVLPFPRPDNSLKTVVSCSYWDRSLFKAAEQTRLMSQMLARREGIDQVSGLDDHEACWPEGLGEIRYQ